MWASGVTTSSGGWVGVESKLRVTFDDAEPSYTAANHTQILLDTADYDTNSEFDIVTNNRWDVAVSGYYHLASIVNIEPNGADLRMVVKCRLNGADMDLANSWITHIISPFTWFVLGADVQLTAGDYIDLWLHQLEGGSQAKIHHASLSAHRFA